MAPGFTIEKHWDGNDGLREARNGRTYVSTGRWVWLLLLAGTTVGVYATKREARAAALTFEEAVL